MAATPSQHQNHGDSIVPAARIESLDIAGTEVLAVQAPDGTPYVPLRRLCEAFGLELSAQRIKVLDNPYLSSVVSKFRTAGKDGKSYVQLCLRADAIPAWLMTLQTSVLDEDLLDQVVAFQREAAAVLYRWATGAAANGITREEFRRIARRVAAGEPIHSHPDAPPRGMLGEPIKRLMARRGLSYAALASNFGVSQGYLRDVVNGAKTGIPLRIKLCKRFKTGYQTLFGERLSVTRAYIDLGLRRGDDAQADLFDNEEIG